MSTQSILKTMGTIGQEILTALFEGISRLGCGLGGLPYDSENRRSTDDMGD